ncbi:ashwin isoform X2 [Triplophysa dalaica]|uniref:ashwin isoform X2 n=1 Tax=Triplophysa dalaica TaxID=1582913 RepID=UPI0024DFE9AB|nr:ashwin isoform X2 [Triplophysa dalaica]
MSSRRQENTKERTSNSGDVSNVDCLLHPELLSREFIQLVLHERKIAVDDHEDSDRLTDLYMRHVIPLPQRDLSNTRWAKRVERCRERQSSGSVNSSGIDSGRKRPLIVFDGSSTNTGSVKLKKPFTLPAPAVHDRLKPPVSSASLSNPIRKLSGSSTNNASSNSHNITPVSPPGSGHKSPAATCNHSDTASASVHSNNMTSKLKRTAPSDTAKDIKSPDMKKKVQHIKWP